MKKQKEYHPSMQPYLDGQVILFDKPLKWTSFDIIKKVRYQTRIAKVGHAGTLDPLATGLLIVCTGKFTKQINDYMGMEKEYTGTITLGATTPTFDLESEPTNITSLENITAQKVLDATAQFTGAIMQMPPMHSAIKKDGQRLYYAARSGEIVEIDPRPVTIYEFEITNIELPVVHFRVRCSTGTYIRSLAHDLGQLLQTGAYMSSLRRTRIGEFRVADALSPDQLQQQIIASAGNLEGKSDTQL